VEIVETRLIRWLEGEGWDLGNREDQEPQWTVVDDSPVDIEAEATAGPSSSSTTSRRMPERHQLRNQLPALPRSGNQLPAILELSRSPAHVSWAIADGFDRLVTHLVVRYYELVSWSWSTSTCVQNQADQ
jgi:hypothetical protein